MQYILSESEYGSLLDRVRQSEEMPSKTKLQEFCTMVANSLPVKEGRSKDKIWGCILTNNGYCDECPSKNICPIYIRNGVSKYENYILNWYYMPQM